MSTSCPSHQHVGETFNAHNCPGMLGQAVFIRFLKFFFAMGWFVVDAGIMVMSVLVRMLLLRRVGYANPLCMCRNVKTGRQNMTVLVNMMLTSCPVTKHKRTWCRLRMHMTKWCWQLATLCRHDVYNLFYNRHHVKQMLLAHEHHNIMFLHSNNMSTSCLQSVLQWTSCQANDVNVCT